MYRYNIQMPIPAPTLKVKLRNPITGGELEKDGKIDSGADLIAIPSEVVRELELEQRGIERVFGYKRDILEEVPVYYVDVEVAGFPFKMVRALAVPRRDILLGRNVLNKLKIVLDGKNLAFEVFEP